jgi:hypothetical protein
VDCGEGALLWDAAESGIVDKEFCAKIETVPNAKSSVSAAARPSFSRNANGTFGGPSIVGETARDFPIPQSSCGIPATAAAYSLNFTVVPHGSLGYLTVWPTGLTQPLVSTLNSLDGRIKATASIVSAGSSGPWGAKTRPSIPLLAKKVGMPHWALKKRARELGLARTKERPWTDRELEILARYAWMSDERIRLKLKAAGYARSATAIHLKLLVLGLKSPASAARPNQESTVWATCSEDFLEVWSAGSWAIRRDGSADLD